MSRLRLGRTGTVFGGVGVLGCLWTALGVAMVLLCIGSIFVIIFGSFRASEPFQQGTLRAQDDPRVVRAMGEPVRIGWLVSGSIETSGNSGEADLRVPISGPRNKGTLHITAYKSQGVWQFTRLEVETKDNPEWINLLEE